ncbi:MAG: haloacid dehalogenase [Peptococcaceae bacterium BICA1-7]|nr:MAG: haloacid dehalogenase [Peptococcaceae bacterium BICA1-7]HBV96021.1 haloacid dehalogenase [Desulfotomaculum sp.]
MTVETFLFDLDGTLINSIPLITGTFKKVFEHFGLPWKNGEVLKTIGIPLREVAQIYLPGRAEEFIEKYTLFQGEKHADYVKLYPGSLKMLAAIKSGSSRTGVVTSKRRAPALADMEITGLKSYIDVAVTVEDVVMPKPHPEPVIEALNLLRAKPEKAVFIGDSWYDIMAGKQAGVLTVGVTWGMASREELLERGPDFIVDSCDELEKLILSLAAGHRPAEYSTA